MVLEIIRGILNVFMNCPRSQVRISCLVRELFFLFKKFEFFVMILSGISTQLFFVLHILETRSVHLLRSFGALFNPKLVCRETVIDKHFFTHCYLKKISLVCYSIRKGARIERTLINIGVHCVQWNRVCYSLVLYIFYTPKIDKIHLVFGNSSVHNWLMLS